MEIFRWTLHTGRVRAEQVVRVTAAQLAKRAYPRRCAETAKLDITQRSKALW